ncbi:hypothetical protein [Shewanella xiamenensis]|uniref:hypothetical protein n=1 Tax=Shewanella xiamenensis TaxID=332186 RepID=UPI0004D57C62|nr:hypothetical protein [Shewanella xiamenensis]KEK26823.1 hypothetical protein SXM_3624 [Shewanella xiamenensis]
MHKFSFVLVLLGLVSCTSSQQYNENVRGIISYELDDTLYKLTKDHLVCYTCETGTSPNTVAELIAFKPAAEECKAIFKNQEFDFIDQQVNEFKITTKRWEDRISYVFTLEGLSFEESSKTKAPISQTMTVYDNEAECPHKLLKRDSQCMAFSACGRFCD